MIYYIFLLQQGTSLKKKTVEAIHVWIRNCLEPLECLWVNYYRLLIAGLNGRTTSIGEALHWASKGAFDGCNASMSQATSANTQMTQSERKGKKVARLNAQNVQMTNLWSDLPTHEHLTDYAERLTNEQWTLSLDRKVVQVANNKYYVYMPDDGKVPKGK